MNYINRSSHCKFTLLVLAFAVFGATVFGQSKNAMRAASLKEQTSFSSESAISKPVKLPENILTQLAEYDGGQLEKCQQDDFTRKPTAAAHFAASKLNLNGDALPDLIVQARTPCFMGAHNTTFWMFTADDQNSSAAYKLIFDVPADYLKVLKTSSNGYRDLETASHTAVELYTIKWTFDGEKYQKSECRLTDEKNKVSLIKCNS